MMGTRNDARIRAGDDSRLCGRGRRVCAVGLCGPNGVAGLMESKRPDPKGGVSVEPLLDEKEAAGLLQVAVKALQRRRVQGNGPRYVKLGGRCFYRESELEEYVESCLRQGTRE